MLHALLIIILAPFAFLIVMNFINVFILEEGGSSPYTPSPPSTGPLIPPVFWIYGSAAICAIILVAAMIEKYA